MHVLMIGDVIGKPGRIAAKELIRPLRRDYNIDLVIANGENSAGGFGITPETAQELLEYGVDIISTSGKNFVSDLNSVLQQLDDVVFVTSGDLPLLDEEIITKIIENYRPNKTWTSIVTTLSFQQSLDKKSDYIVENDNYVQTGISIVDSKKISNLDPVKEDFLVINDKRIGINLNTKSDYNLLSTF